MKKLIFLIVFIFFFFCLNIFSQNIQFAREIIDTLASDSFAGRGYSDNGINKAADFIEKNFLSSGLHQFHNNYRQDFTVNTNTITRAVIHNRKFRAGDDFVVSVISEKYKGKRKVKILDLSANDGKFTVSDLKKYSGKFVLFLPASFETAGQKTLVYSLIYSDVLNAAGYIIGSSVQPAWDVQYLRTKHGKPVLTLRGDDEDFRKLRKLNLDIDNQYYPEYPVTNLYGYFPGTKQIDSLIVFCAHYDHLGKMGDVIYPGANDNASGVAMMLDLMNYFSQTENRLPFSVVFIALAAEEAGILGAKHFTEHPPFDLKKISFLVNLDLVGTGREGIQVVNGSVFKDHFALLQSLNMKFNYLPEIKSRGEACNSDHCPFYRKSVPSFFIYTLDSDYTWYHVPQDEASRLPLTGYEGLFRLLVDFSRQLSH
jgi:aminopeptidase YwaD